MFVFVGIIQAWYHRLASFHFSFQHVYRKKNLYFPEYINNSQPESRKSSHGRSGERRAWNMSRRIVSHRIGKDRRDKTFFEASKRRGLARRRGKNRRGGEGRGEEARTGAHKCSRRWIIAAKWPVSDTEEEGRGKVWRAGHVVYKASDHTALFRPLVFFPRRGQSAFRRTGAVH